jgi:hypothetical protein
MNTVQESRQKRDYQRYYGQWNQEALLELGHEANMKKSQLEGARALRHVANMNEALQMASELLKDGHNLLHTQKKMSSMKLTFY